MRWFGSKREIRSFDEDTARLTGLARHYAGIRPIATGDIIGSLGRVHELRADFMPNLRPDGDERFRRVRQAMEEGRMLPAIDVYKLGNRYYVVDGHHRVAAARSLGILALDAVVTEFTSAPVLAAA
jgi:hypothetical protein